MNTSGVLEIEKALVNVLRERLQPLGVLVESYGAQLDDEHSQWLRTLPCVWVTFERTNDTRRIARRRYRNTVTFQVMAAQRALQGEPAARHGAHGELGVYEILDKHVKGVLADSNVGLPIDPFTLTGMQMVLQGLFASEAVAVMSSGWRTTYVDVIDEPELQQPGELRTVGLQYVLKPGDDQPDAADLVTLTSP